MLVNHHNKSISTKIQLENIKSKRYCYFYLGIVVIEAHEQNTTSLKFKVPLVPYLPALSILFNVELMANLNFLTWIRFILWMAIGKQLLCIVIFAKTNSSEFSSRTQLIEVFFLTGLLLYFGYGIRNSKLNDSSSPYLVLLSSSEGEKTNWGTISKKKVRSHLSSLYDDDTEPIINDD